MNITIIFVIGAVACLVPLSLLAAFAVSKDNRDYVHHYDAQGFSVEACNRNAKKVTNANGIMVAKPVVQVRQSSGARYSEKFTDDIR